MYFLRRVVFRLLPWEKRSCFREKNGIFPDNAAKIKCRRGPFWKDHLFRKLEGIIIFPCIFLRKSSFIFRLTCNIIFSGKTNIIFPDNTRKILFQCNFFGKIIISGIPEKENMVFRTVVIIHKKGKRRTRLLLVRFSDVTLSPCTEISFTSLKDI